MGVGRYTIDWSGKGGSCISDIFVRSLLYTSNGRLVGELKHEKKMNEGHNIEAGAFMFLQ
jgi:hypothetical protein